MHPKQASTLTKEDDTTANRRGGVGALLGYATGLSVGLGYGVVRPLIGWVPLPLRALAVGAVAMAARHTDDHAGGDRPQGMAGIKLGSRYRPASGIRSPHRYGL